jgi:hypothetical protein
MIVYVESNFVLELAFLQEEYESCLELLHLVLRIDTLNRKLLENQ